ncbi:MAG: PhnD/SsuA/transferrin family substrate-binding protein, partial [Planctomycetota bacterium]
MKLLRRAVFLAALAAAWAPGCRRDTPASQPAGEPLRVIVMDPLADELACACIPGYAQRRYPDLCGFLSRRLARPVAYVHAEDLTGALNLCDGRADLIVGRRSLVAYDAAETATAVRPIAMLTDKQGRTDLAGVFVVRKDDPAKTVADLGGRTMVLGSADSAETHADARATLKARSVKLAAAPEPRSGDGAVALAVIEREADAGVVADYALPLLEGCGAIDPGSLRVIGKTDPAPFVTVFATGRIGPDQEKAILDALRAVRTDPKLLKTMESRDGFVPVGANQRHGSGAAGWPDWRGPRRDGLVDALPASLPDKPRVLWRRRMTGWGMSGVAATTRYAIVSDKDPTGRKDVWRCFDADTGKGLWTVQYDAPDDMEYSNSPRAAPVIRQGRAYLLGAFGDLLC